MIKYKHLEGLPFIHGSQDCYGLARRFYKDNWNIELTDYARPDRWWDLGMDLYRDNFYAEGFRVVDEPIHKIKVGDALLVAVRSSVPNHVGMYVGEGKVLHHFYGKLSRTSNIDGMFRNGLCAILRHKDVVLEETHETIDLMDLLPPFKRRQLEELQAHARASSNTSSESPPELADQPANEDSVHERQGTGPAVLNPV